MTNTDKLTSLFASFLIEADLNQSQQERARTLLIEVEKLVPEWIAVTDRLPDSSDDVLINSQYGVGIGYFNLFHWECLRRNETVTHWQPLPPAPDDLEGLK